MLFGWWKRTRHAPEGRGDQFAIPFRILCECGGELRGDRGPAAETKRCPSCGRPRLIYPTSPLVNLRETIRLGLQRPIPEAPPPPKKIRKRISRWRTPLLAVSFTIVVVVSFFLIVFESSLFRKGKLREAANRAYIQDETNEGRRALAESAFAEAAEHFKHARARLITDEREKLSAEARWLEQLEQEASIMADLSSESLPQILEISKAMGEQAWRNLFKVRYQNKPLIFDATVSNAGGGVYRIDYALFQDGNPVRIEIHDSPLLKSLNLTWPARLLIGVRLLEARRDSNGEWLVTIKPESVVLLTESAMFTGSSVVVDADLAQQLHKQAGWLNVGPPKKDDER